MCNFYCYFIKDTYSRHVSYKWEDGANDMVGIIEYLKSMNILLLNYLQLWFYSKTFKFAINYL